MAHSIDAHFAGKPSIQLSPLGDAGGEPAKATRRRFDPKKIFLITGLAALSWVSTYSGMLELIEANLGELEFVFKIAVAGSVAMLMLMIVWLLDQMFNRDHAGSVRALYLAGYVFLSLISIGFSFGFYWKFLESRTEGTKIAEQAVVGVQSQLQAAETRLTQLQTTLESLALISTQKAESERVSGNSCPNSRPGDGPRRRLREADAAAFATASQFVKDRAALIKKDIAAFGVDLEKIVKQDKSTFDPKTGTRTDFLKGVTRKLAMTTAAYEAFRSDPQLKQFRADFADRAEKTVFPDEQGKTFTCPDAQIQSALRGGVKAIDALPVIAAPEIVIVEGADATLEAFRRLIYTLTTPAALFSSRSEDIRAAQQRAIQSLGTQDGQPAAPALEGLGKRDYIPLAIAIFVDLCLLLVSIPQATSAAQQARQRRANATGETYRTLDDLFAIHDDEDTRGRLEPLRHIAFDWLGVDYVAVPVVAGTDALMKPKRRPRSIDLISLILTRDEEPEDLRESNDPEAIEARRAELLKDLKEAQFLANFFASHENKGPYRRAVFPRTPTVKRRLARIGSKWANLDTFRLYRFKRGAWSDFVLDVVVGADRELGPVRETQKRNALQKTLLKSKELEFEADIMTVDHETKKSMKLKESEIKQRGADQALQEMEQQLRSKEIELRKQHLENERDVKKLEHELALLEAANDTGEETYPDGRREPLFSLNRLRGTRKVGKAAEPPRSVEPSPEITALLKGVSQLTLAMQHQQQQMAELMRTRATDSPGPAHGYGHGNINVTQSQAAQAGMATGPGATHRHAANGHASAPHTHAGTGHGGPAAYYARSATGLEPHITATGPTPPAVIALNGERHNGQEPPLQGQVLPPEIDGNAALARNVGADTDGAGRKPGTGFGKLFKSGLGGISELFRRAPQSQAPQGGVRSRDDDPIEPLVPEATTVVAPSAHDSATVTGTMPAVDLHGHGDRQPEAPSLLSTREELDRFIREIEESTSRVAARVASPYPAQPGTTPQPHRTHGASAVEPITADTDPSLAEDRPSGDDDIVMDDFGFGPAPAVTSGQAFQARNGRTRRAPHRGGQDLEGLGRTEPHFADAEEERELNELFGDASDTISIRDITKWYGRGRKKPDRRH